MADYFVSGKKGNGKSLFCVGVIRDAIAAGKRVATNLDVRLDVLCSAGNRATIIRLPDRPVEADMIALGRGQAGVAEEDNGVIVLDETSSFFNARGWNDSARQPLLDWFIHSRKYGWDTYFIAQGQEQIDRQIRATQLEYHISVKRTDKWPIPFLTPFVKALSGVDVRMPKFHIGIVRQGMERDALLIERRWYRGRLFYDAYDTQQIFLDRMPDKPDSDCLRGYGVSREKSWSDGLHTVLSAWHVKGRYLGWWAMNRQILWAGVGLGLLLGVAAGGYSGWLVWGKVRPKLDGPAPIESSAKVSGVVMGQDGRPVLAMLSDGHSGPVLGQRTLSDGYAYQVGKKWYRVQ